MLEEALIVLDNGSNVYAPLAPPSRFSMTFATTYARILRLTISLALIFIGLLYGTTLLHITVRMFTTQWLAVLDPAISLVSHGRCIIQNTVPLNTKSVRWWRRFGWRRRKTGIWTGLSGRLHWQLIKLNDLKKHLFTVGTNENRFW